jgi:hypothetical protein
MVGIPTGVNRTNAMTTDNFIVTTRVSAIFCNDKAHGWTCSESGTGCVMTQGIT